MPRGSNLTPELRRLGGQRRGEQIRQQANERRAAKGLPPLPPKVKEPPKHERWPKERQQHVYHFHHDPADYRYNLGPKPTRTQYTIIYYDRKPGGDGKLTTRTGEVLTNVDPSRLRGTIIAAQGDLFSDQIAVVLYDGSPDWGDQDLMGMIYNEDPDLVIDDLEIDTE